jgi:Holliday junction resolvase RusA-like endonuclease
MAHQGHVYAPDPTRNAERSIRLFALKAMARQPPLRGGLSITAMFEFEVPPSWPRYKREAAIIGDICPTGRPDILDNLMKLLRDGLTGVVLDNDAQLVELCAFKKIRHRSEDRCDPQIDLRRAPDFRESGGDTVGIGQS